nr:FAD-binding oxidoreductase [Chloroflexota bacterium]
MGIRPVSRTEVAIIGGGIMGCSLAWHLAKSGVQVTVIERATVAAGASGRTGALLRQHYSNRAEAALAHDGLKTYSNWNAVVGGDCGFVKSGLVVPIAAGAYAEDNLDRLRTNI